MLKLSLVTLMTLQLTGVSASFAAEDSISGLQGVMRDMGVQFGVLTNALLKHQATSQGDLQAAADTLVADVKNAKPRLPDSLIDSAGVPLPGKQAEIQQFNDIMDQLIAGVTKLDVAITAGDNGSATTILTGTIIPIIKQGHGLFKPQE